MKILDAVAKGVPMVVETMAGTRYVAALYPVEGGVVFFDIGWVDSSSHPLHYIKGRLPPGDEPWGLGDVKFRPLEETDEAAGDMLLWKAWLLSPEGLRWGKAEAEAALRNFCEEMEIKIEPD